MECNLGIWAAGAVAISLFATHPVSPQGEPPNAIKSVGTPDTRCAAVDRNSASSRDEINACHWEREESDNRLSKLAASLDSDPVLEAKRAADSGDFRLMGYSMLVPGTFPAAYGIACKPSIVSQGSRMVRLVYATSDVPPTSEAEGADRDRLEIRYRRFGERYNAALIADVRSPYRKMCRVVPRNLETEGGPFRKD